MPAKEIVIDLSSSDHNRPVGSNAELIQRVAFEALKSQIGKDLARAGYRTKQDGNRHSCEESELHPLGSGLTYFIDGTRGAGKSTFLRFTYDHLNELSASNKRSEPADYVASVKPLLYLDPSRIESSEIVLLHILKQLKRIMDSCSDRGRAWGEHQENFRNLFKQMAGGLHLFVSKSDSLKDLDAELFLDYGLDRAADSQCLRRLLHETVDLVCRVSKTDALLLAIDDADTKFSHAIEVLECIRKYLDTPQIVVLVTGDMEMYSLLVQSHFQQDFASDDKGFSPDRKTQQTRMVAHLEEQYLLKLFPVQRRVQLKTLHTLTERMRKGDESSATESLPDFIIKGPENLDKVPLILAVDTIATNGLRLRDRLDLELFRAHVLKLPVRSVLQLLSTYYRLSARGLLSEREAAAEGLRATALSSLYRHDIDVESIAEGDLHAVIEAAFNLGQLDGEPDTAVYLRPQSRDGSLRNACVSLAADVARLCENDPAKAITYMVATAGSNNILNLARATSLHRQAQRGTGDSRDESTLQRKVKQYLSVGRKDNALNWSLHATAALVRAGSASGMQLRQGVIGVRTSSKGSVSTFPAQLNEALAKCKTGPFPAIAFSQSAVKSPSNTQRYLSIFNTLGLISNLLALDVAGELIDDQIVKQLNKIKSVQTVSLPNWEDQATQNEGPERESDDDNQDADHSAALVKLVADIVNWLKTCAELKKHFHPSAMLMGKIWNRLYFSLDNISAAMRASEFEDERCSKAMELFAWALINASLVEEADYHFQNGSLSGFALNRDNPRKSSSVVVKKFDYLSSQLSGNTIGDLPLVAPLALMIATCPLVLGLIKVDEGALRFSSSLNKLLERVPNYKILDHSAFCEEEVWRTVGKTEVSK